MRQSPTDCDGVPLRASLECIPRVPLPSASLESIPRVHPSSASPSASLIASLITSLSASPECLPDYVPDYLPECLPDCRCACSPCLHLPQSPCISPVAGALAHHAACPRGSRDLAPRDADETRAPWRALGGAVRQPKRNGGRAVARRGEAVACMLPRARRRGRGHRGRGRRRDGRRRDGRTNTAPYVQVVE
jgi:hypothetical protein